MPKTASEKIREIPIEIPRPYLFLYGPAPYKTVYGGRFGCKDWSYARVLLHLQLLYTESMSDVNVDAYVQDFEKAYGIKGDLIRTSIKFPHRVLCVREIQQSIKDSVHALLKDQITMLGLTDRFLIKDDCIVRRDGGGDFRFCGLYRNSYTVKSKEGITIAWVCEAENVSEDSWKYFCPTIRKDGSEKWISFNTRYEDDPTFQRFVVDPPEGSIVRFINSTDVEKYLTPIAKLDRKSDYARDPQTARNVWGGEPLGKGRKIYQLFDKKIHLKSFGREWLKERANFFMGCDPAQHYYPACLWGALFPDDTGEMIKYIYAEYPTFDNFEDYFCNIRKKLPFTGTLADLSREFYLKDGKLEWGYHIRARGIDTRFAKGTGAGNYFSNSTTGLVGEFAKKDNGGIMFECPDVKVIDVQLKEIIRDMEYNTLVEIGSMNHPHLYIDPACRNLIQSLENHRLEEDCERESEKYKDFSDALKILYATMSMYEYERPSDEELEREYNPYKHLGITPCEVSANAGEAWMRS